MRRSALIAAVVGGLVSSSAFAAYQFDFQRDTTFTTAGFDRYVLFALGTGAQASDPIFAGDITLNTVNNGLKFSNPLDTDGDDVVDTVPVTIGNPAAATRTRYNGIVFQTVAPGFPQPPNSTANGGSGDLAAYQAGLNRFQLVGFDGRPGGPGVAADASQNGGKGAAVLAAVVPSGAPIPTFDPSSNIAGRSGFIQVISLVPPPTGDTVAPVVVVAPPTLTVDVAPPGTENFVANVSATDNVGVTGLSLTSGLAGTAIADNVIISGGTTGPLTVTGSGLTFNDLGTYTLTFTGTDAAGNAGTGTFTLTVVPEPTTLVALAGIASFGMIRRRK